MTNLQVEPVIFETQALFDLDITLQASGYKVNNHYAKGAARVKAYSNLVTGAYLVFSEVIHENKLTA